MKPIRIANLRDERRSNPMSRAEMRSRSRLRNRRRRARRRVGPASGRGGVRSGRAPIDVGFGGWRSAASGSAGLMKSYCHRVFDFLSFQIYGGYFFFSLGRVKHGKLHVFSRRGNLFFPLGISDSAVQWWELTD